VNADNGSLEAQKMEPLRVYTPVVADLHHSDEEQDPGSGSASK
jgi:hypothetical protein